MADSLTKPGADSKGDVDVEKLQAELEKWRSHSRKNEARFKETAAQLDEIKKSGWTPESKSELERLASLVEESENARKQAELGKLRLEIADEFGLTKKQAARLTGKDEDELRSDAEELVELFGVSKSNDKTDDKKDEDSPPARSRVDTKRLRSAAQQKSSDDKLTQKEAAEIADRVSQRRRGGI